MSIPQCVEKLHMLAAYHDLYQRTWTWDHAKEVWFVTSTKSLQPCATKIRAYMDKLTRDPSPAAPMEYKMLLGFVKKYEALDQKAEKLATGHSKSRTTKLLNIDKALSEIDPNYDARFLRSQLPSVPGMATTASKKGGGRRTRKK